MWRRVFRRPVTAPSATPFRLRRNIPPAPHRRSIGLGAESVTAIVWATGFSYDFSWIDLPVCDEMGCPVTDRGATSVPGLYFMGLDWMVPRKSGLLSSVGDDARHAGEHIARFAVCGCLA